MDITMLVTVGMFLFLMIALIGIADRILKSIDYIKENGLRLRVDLKNENKKN